MPNLFEFTRFSSYPGANPLDILKPYGLYKPADRLMRYDGITNIKPRFHPSTSIFKVRNTFYVPIYVPIKHLHM